THSISTLFPYTTLFRSSAFSEWERPAIKSGDGSEGVPAAPCCLDVPCRHCNAMDWDKNQGGFSKDLKRTKEKSDVSPRSSGIPRSEEHTSELQSRENLV